MVRKSNIIRRRLGHNSLAVNRSSVWPLLWVESFTNWVRLKQSNSTKQSLVIVELVWSVCVLKYPRISILLNTTKTINWQIQSVEMTVNCKAEILKTTRHSKDVNIGLDTELMLIFNDTPRVEDNQTIRTQGSNCIRNKVHYFVYAKSPGCCL